jgi:hypothetical protein
MSAENGLEIEFHNFKCIKIRILYKPSISKDLHIPSGESMPSFMNCTATAGFKHRLAPPTIAASQCPLRILCNAWSRANKLDEHAVSIV